MIKVVFIDIDNTLLSFSEYVKKAMNDGFAKFKIKPYTETMFPIFEKINNSLWKRIEQGTLSYEELMRIRWNMIFKELDIDFDGEIFEEYFKEQLFDSAIPEKNAKELLEYLSGRYQLCVASNGPYEQQINRLRVAGMYDYFTHIFISSKVGAQKPSAEFFEYCFKELRASEFPQLLAEETIILGDSYTSDMVGEIAYGMQTCFYQKDAFPEDKISQVDYVVDSLAKVKQVL